MSKRYSEASLANYCPLTPLDFLDRAVELFAERPAVYWRERQWSYAQLGGMVRDMVKVLRQAGVGSGDVVAVMSTNRPEMLAAHFAIPAVGGKINALNTRLDAGTVRHILEHSGACLYLADNAAAPLLAEVASKLNIAGFVFAEDDHNCGSLNLLSPSAVPACDFADGIMDELQPIALNYTSGTTSNPKGVMLNHRGAYLIALGNVIALGLDAQSAYLLTLPMFHVNGWGHTWAVTADSGAHVCLDKVIPADIYSLIAKRGVTHMACAPVVLHMLLKDPARHCHQSRHAVRVASGGAAPTSKLIEQMGELGFEFIHLYGLTESFGPTTMRRLAPDEAALGVDAKVRLLSRQGGRHITANRIAVVDDQGQPVPADGKTLGEIVLRGNTLMMAYKDAADSTAEAFSGGVFHTGDLAVMHPGHQVEIRDRAKDLIISGGENISSLEVESALSQHPSVSLAAVVAQSDEKWGEIPVAFIELVAGAAVDEEQLREFCRERLAHFKVPRRFIFDELPKTATGKIQKYALRQSAGATAAVSAEAET